MTEIRSTDYFAIIPEQVLYADISANAVRLYGILNRFANSHGHAWPSRKTIAEAMRVSIATVDRAKDELVSIGALIVEPRTTPSGDPSSNLYILQTTLSPMREGTPTREERGMVTGDALKRDSMNQRKKAPHKIACGDCLGKNRTGYTDGTEGLSHVWIEMKNVHFPGQGIRDIGRYVVCEKCGGTGVRQ